MSAAAALPTSYKSLAHYVKIGGMYFTVEKGMQIDKSTAEAKTYLVTWLDALEKLKKANHQCEAITEDMVGQAHVEEVMLKLHTWADNQDRAGVFNKNVVKAFYTAGHLVDVLEVFGTVEPHILDIGKYDKWKATYIHNCLKNGQTPEAGPPGGMDVDVPQGPPAPQVPQGPPAPQVPSASLPAPIVQPAAVIHPSPSVSSDPTAQITAQLSGVTVSGPAWAAAQKYAKYAISSMQYEDQTAAMDNLNKAMHIVQTGQII